MDIYIWGTGSGCIDIIDKMIALDDVCGFIDNNVSKKTHLGKKVYSPSQIKNIQFDAILVATSHSKEIYDQCNFLGIDISKVVFLFNHYDCVDLNKNYVFAEKILGNENVRWIREHRKMVEIVQGHGDFFLKDCPIQSSYSEVEYLRLKSLELVVKEIKKRNLQGAVAEVGVYKGDFAQYIHYAFRDRICYLFDTFCGFDANEAEKEISDGNATHAFINRFNDTSEKFVLEKMFNPSKIIIKKGLFPNSLEGLEDTFVFVSIDVDFGDSMYECIKYFYPRLVCGGYIFLHDYNSDYRNVEKAVDRYESEMFKILPKVPLVDKGGTLVLVK